MLETQASSQEKQPFLKESMRQSFRLSPSIRLVTPASIGFGFERFNELLRKYYKANKE